MVLKHWRYRDYGKKKQVTLKCFFLTIRIFDSLNTFLIKSANIAISGNISFIIIFETIQGTKSREVGHYLSKKDYYLLQ